MSHYEKLTDENYMAWSVMAKLQLQTADLWDTANSKPKDLPKALSMLSQMIGLGQIMHVSGTDKAPDMWDALAGLRVPSSFDNVFNLKSRFYGLKYSGDNKTDLDKHVQKIKELSYQLS